jgi:hypothetical protein
LRSGNHVAGRKGCCCFPLNWIEDFLTLRTQTVILDSEKSEKIHVTVLGPVLFLVYINESHEYIKHFDPVQGIGVCTIVFQFVK